MHTENPVFSRVSVDCIIAGGTRVSWELNRHFIDPGPYSFQLQVGHTGLEDADDWTNVGAPVVDTYFTLDSEQRVWGKTQETHYRVELITSVDTYYSEPENCDGHLSKRDWLVGREIVRKELLRHRVLTSPEGFLLKARRYGPRCSVCTDEHTEEVNNSNCPACYGTGFENGYFEPMPACFADVGNEQSREHRIADRGMVKEDVISARFIGDPQLYSYDVWVNRTSGKRYYLHTISVKGHIRSVPIIFDAELRLAPFSDVVYTVPIDENFTILRKMKQQQHLEQECQPQKKPELNYLAIALDELKGRRRRSSRR